MVHIEVWASLNRAGDLCLDIMRGHADPGADMVSFELEARQTGVVWTQDGPDISDVAPLRVGTRGCVRFTAEVTMAGAGEADLRLPRTRPCREPVSGLSPHGALPGPSRCPRPAEPSREVTPARRRRA